MAQESASLVYRLPGQTEGRIRKILDIPTARSVLEGRSLGRLLETGWLENTVEVLEEEGSDAEVPA